MDNVTIENLLLCHVNCQSLVAHLDEFRLFFNANHYHIICISETWLRPSITNDFLSLPGYTLIRCDRIGKTGGGVAMYISNLLNITILAQSNGEYCKKPEYMIAEVLVGSEKILVASVYRPPKIGFLNEFEDKLLDIYSDYENLVIFGDFNADLYTPTYDSNHLREFIDSSNLYLVPYNPTHHLKNSSTWLDICAVDCEEKVLTFGQEGVPFLSAHDLISINYNIKVSNANPRRRRARDFRNFSLPIFLHHLSNQNWLEIAETNDIDNKIELFNNILLSSLDTNAPETSFVPKKKPAPWLTPHIKGLMTARNQAHRSWRRRKTACTYNNYRILRNQVKWEISREKACYYHRIFGNHRSCNETWSELRRLGLIRNTRNDTSLSIKIDDLNNHFSETCTSSTYIEPFLDERTEFSDRKLYLTEPTMDDLLDAFSTSTSSSTGIDEISIGTIKKAFPVIVNIILHIFSFSIMYEVYPSLWKHAIICPIPKVKLPSLPTDYRPISLLCSLSKALEKIVASQIIKHMETTKKLDPFQSAYRKGHSTQTALLRVLDAAKRAADDRMVTIMVLFDFSKAFDRVVHSKLIEILKKLGFSDSALQWIISYLKDRKQSVRDNDGNVSASRSINTGVPQGSVLGPLLFSLYISGLSKIFTICSHNVYADDIQILLSCHPKDLARAIAMVNEEICRLVKWSEDLGLLLNRSKTKAIIVGTARFVKSINVIDLPKINVDGIEVAFSDTVEYLGVTITNDLSWSTEARRRSKKIYGTLHQLKVVKSLLPKDLRANLISSLVFPFLDYCCVAMTDITKEAELIIQRALNSCVRFIADSKRHEHITPFYTELRWLKVRDRRNYFECSLLFSILITKRPEYLSYKISYRKSHSTRADVQLLAIPTCRTELYNKSFLRDGPLLWNRLPLNIRCSASLQEFKTKLHNHLLRQSSQ